MSIALEREPVSVRDLAERTLRIFALQAREHGVTLESRLPADPLHVPGDSTNGWALESDRQRCATRPGRFDRQAEGSLTSCAVADSGHLA
jgi:hypothetical protein